MRRLKARPGVPLLAASLFCAACSTQDGTQPAASQASPTPAAPAGEAPPALPPPTDMVTTNIPGVLAAGTPIQILKTGFEGAEGPVGMPDGSVLFTETRASRIARTDPDGNVSTFLDRSNEFPVIWKETVGRRKGVQFGDPTGRVKQEAS
jgi:gluconolactonase